MERKEIEVSLITPNKGQVPGLPRNPRLVKKERYETTKRSIEECPEMLDLREVIVVEYMEGKYVAVCGNLRLRACKELGYKTVPCKVLPGDTPPKKLREYAAKDNINYGEDLRPLDNFEQSVDEGIFSLPLRYKTIKQGVAALFDA